MESPAQPWRGMSRRRFMGTSAIALGAGATLGATAPVFGQQEADVNPLLSSQLGVKFVVGGMVHETAHEGPCRVGKLEDLTYEAEVARHQKSFEHFAAQLKQWDFPPEANVLEPADFRMVVKKRDVDFKFPQSEFAKLEKEADKTDVFVVVRGFVSDICLKLAERFGKPVLVVAYEGQPRRGPGWVVDAPAAVRHRGMESYVAYDREDLNGYLRLMWVRKAFAHTKLLIVTDRFGQPPFGLASAMYDFDRLGKLYGMQCHNVSNQALADEIERILHAPEEREKVDQFAQRLMDGAEAVHMTKEHVVHSGHFYYAVRNLMRRFGCNAFTIECREICPLELAAKYQFTPCMTFSLLKDAGYPAVCQTDINALLAMMTLSYLSRRAVYMGNPDFFAEDNVVTIFHDVPGLKMKGFNEPSLPYELRNFTVGGWGVTLRYNFNRDRGQPVTIARFNPAGDRILITRGEIAGGFGVDNISCSLGLTVKVPDALALFRKSANYGGHLVMAYGDHVQDVQDLSEIMAFDVESVL